MLFSLLLCLSAYNWKNGEVTDQRRVDAGQFIECFSLRNNWKRLFCCEVSKDAIPAVDGLR